METQDEVKGLHSSREFSWPCDCLRRSHYARTTKGNYFNSLSDSYLAEIMGRFIPSMGKYLLQSCNAVSNSNLNLFHYSTIFIFRQQREAKLFANA